MGIQAGAHRPSSQSRSTRFWVAWYTIPPAVLHALTWMSLDGPFNRILGKVALRLLRARS
jgi:hypothetical protein